MLPCSLPYFFAYLLGHNTAKGRRKESRDNHLACNSARYSSILWHFCHPNILSNKRFLINLVISNPTTPSICSYTTLQFVVNRLFSMFHEVVWQHTHARCGGIFSNHFTANLQGNLVSEKNENRLRFDRIMAMSFWSHFLADLVR